MLNSRYSCIESEIDQTRLPQQIIVRIKVARRDRSRRAHPHVDSLERFLAILGRHEIRRQIRELIDELMLREIRDVITGRSTGNRGDHVLVDELGESFHILSPRAVSYTHLTLPTNREV